ncbi:MAG: DNA polymerase III subunit alpha [Gammaproteobacteria bacterium]|nr:DNA polymerase III subunit alpha [Gammaproteobacteria bacterium]
MSASFVHLHLHTEYSLSDSVVRVKPLMEAVAKMGMPAVALTDQCNLFAMVKFYRAALARGIKPIIGVDVLLRDIDEPTRPSRLTLLCQNQVGYRNLSRLVSRSFLEGQYRGVPMLDPQWLSRENCDGLIALSGGVEGDIGRALLAGHTDLADRRLAAWRTVFGDRFYLEITRTGRPDEEEYLQQAVQLSAEQCAPVLASNDVRFISASEFGAHEARVCIHDGHVLTDASRPRRYSEQQYLRSAEDMQQLFADLPEALENSVEIAKRCNLELSLGGSDLPEFPIPEGQTTAGYLHGESVAGLCRRLGLDDAGVLPDEYRQRLEHEIDVICEMGFPGYFLIVADFIHWSRENDIPVGPGRGSGAGSLVAYALQITDLDPIAHDLLFERFLNPERVSMPDFDIDFCMEGRDRVIDYVAGRYGRDRVSQIITYGTMAAKAVIRDVGRVLGHPYGFVDRIAKLIPFELGITLEKALEQEDELRNLYESDDEVRNLINLARQLEGLVRNAGKHAGGVVIAPRPLTDYAPLYCEEGGANVVTQFDKDDVEACGLVKFDFLGLRTLTVIDRAVKIINGQRRESGEPPLDIDAIDPQDSATFDLLKKCRTVAVFQLESRGMKDLIKRLQPDNFGEIVALVALFRPGPLQSGMVDDFINRKHAADKTKIDYFHPDLKSILEPTYGVILYQEQVMQIAQVLAGYSLGEADLLRRAMGKKKPEEMAKQRGIFLRGAEKAGVNTETATFIFDLMEKFAGYGFNKSHSAAYAVLAYRTAWLKAHHPAAFMAAVLSTDMDNTDKVVTLIDECAAMDIEVAVPDINHSGYAFVVSGPRTIRYGLGAIKGVGRGALEGLIAERSAGGAFAGIVDLCQRIDLQKLNRRVMEALIRAGAMDSLGVGRAALLAQLPAAMKLAEQDAKASAAGQDDMFGFSGTRPQTDELPVPRNGGRDRDAPEEDPPEWSEKERLDGEFDTLGLYLTGHPITRYEKDLPQLAGTRIADLGDGQPMGNGRHQYAIVRKVTVAGVVLKMGKRGNRVTLQLDDRSGRVEVTLFDEAYQEFGHLLQVKAVLVIHGGLRYDDFSNGWQITAKKIQDIDAAREQMARKLIIEWQGQQDGQQFVHELKGTLRPYLDGHCGVWVRYTGSGAKALLALGDDWQVRPTRELLDKLDKLVGGEHLKLVYPPPL